jgi:hypothetical protein
MILYCSSYLESLAGSQEKIWQSLEGTQEKMPTQLINPDNNKDNSNSTNKTD